MRYAIFTFIVLIIAAFGAYYFINHRPNDQLAARQEAAATTITPATEQASVATPSDVESIGTSAGDHDILAYHFGTGSTEIVFIGGMHGGYEWNTVLVANDLIDHLRAHPEAVSANQTVTVIPVVNPDGLQKVVGTTTRFTSAQVPSSQSAQVAGRVNANDVDLNRNFDCDWKARGVWQSTPVSGGSAAFSEPESMAIKSYIENRKPAGVVVWFSAAGGVYASNCHGGVSSETSALTALYAGASGYPAHESFDFYSITGDMTNWLAKVGVPAISVLLTNHTDPEWDKNLAGIQAVLRHYAQ